ncbi:MAG: hypothetical protein C5B49_08925 [Bdellovibrio sp.]|nr:MAG: hypothetical protein C5B49_08925 [Bdellovibrio sp.]
MGAAVLFALTVYCFVSVALTPTTVTFRDAREFKDFALSKGFFLHSGNENDIINSNYYLADHPITLDDVNRVPTRIDCGLTPAWCGILWVSQIDYQGLRIALHTNHIGGKSRVWGNVLVAGDEDLMDRIEALYANVE